MTKSGNPSKPKPLVAASTILYIGTTAFTLAYVWPPLLLVVALFFSITVPYSFRINDSGEARRRLWNEFLKRDDLPVALKCQDVELEERYWINSRGMCLLTSTMVPKDNAVIRGVIFLCHGYMDNSSLLKRIEYQRFVQKGFAVVMIEYEGHGRSDGPNTLIPCWNAMIGDVEQYFDEIAREKFPDKKRFLMGESMGGAIAYDLMNRNRSVYEGVILAAPMCKVLNAPPDWVVKIFEAICGKPGSVNAFSIMPIAPTKGNIPDLSFKDKHKMALATSVPTSFGRKPRLATARELLVSEFKLRYSKESTGLMSLTTKLLTNRRPLNVFRHLCMSLMLHSSFCMGLRIKSLVQRYRKNFSRIRLLRTNQSSYIKVRVNLHMFILISLV
jgi:pimeloyl-ACP methyl ester carboxylesterase